ncbi:MAG: hypothetical protein O2999_05735 [Nitrospirae bacterium]|nr:hypothetical protein [Nitrospirota bacterium]MDA1303787.1 hypothetical protein [Nitrospirota bacterium]
MKTILTVALLLACVGCADPMLITRPVQDEPSLFVGLASHNDPEKEVQVQHNHPMEWSEADLHTILTRLLVQGQGGIMDPLKQPRAVFSPDNISLLIPALRETFKAARSSDWVVFALWDSSPESQALEVTSGGMFLQNQRLHFILSNHRERVSSEQDGIKGIRRNPLYSLRDIKKGKLSFDPTRYMIDSRDNWMAGGYDAPASELVLDLKSLLAQNNLLRPPSADSSGGSTPAPSTQSEVGELKDEISNLKEELSRLQDLITNKAEEGSRRKNP